MSRAVKIALIVFVPGAVVIGGAWWVWSQYSPLIKAWWHTFDLKAWWAARTSSSGSAPTGQAVPGQDAEVTVLNLDAQTAAVAQWIKSRNPKARFTSGYRAAVPDQARAMSQNVAQRGGGAAGAAWIAGTYAKPPAKIVAALMQWCTDNPDVTDAESIEAGFSTVIGTFQASDWGHLSKHILHRAFDVQPIVDGDGNPTGDGVKLHDDLKAIGAKVGKFLDNEGGEVRWHLQMNDGLTDDAAQAAVA